MSMFAALSAFPCALSGDTGKWAPLRAGVEAWHALSFDGAFSVNVGSDAGTLFRWESPGFSSSTTRMPGASLSKWPAAIMLAGLVHDGTLGWDDLASKHLTWWTKDPKDPRSRVTLKHLLSFTSGYYEDGSASPFCGHGVAQSDQFLACAQSLYEKSKSYGAEPGTTWSYLGCHLQFAGAMAVAASGVEIDRLFERYLYRPFNMTSTTWTPTKNPQLAVGITTTANDFENLLRRLLTYEVLPKAILDVMETDYSQPPCKPSGDGWFGHYGMGHWWECLGYGTPSSYEREALPKECTAAAVQAGPGMFGYYPLLDRSGGGGHAGPQRPRYYLQIALQEPEPLSGIPEYLRMLVKPVVDVILSGADPETFPRAQLLAQGGGLLRRDLEDIESELQACTCKRHAASEHSAEATPEGEPYASLSASLKPDEPRLSRRDLTARRGEGLLLRELTQVQRRLGTCACKGRKDATAAAAAALNATAIVEAA